MLSVFFLLLILVWEIVSITMLAVENNLALFYQIECIRVGLSPFDLLFMTQKTVLVWSFYKLNELIHMQQVTGSSHVRSESTNDDVAADEGLHDGSRVALENRNYRNQATCEGAGAGRIQG
jgi:hypothetical protein